MYPSQMANHAKLQEPSPYPGSVIKATSRHRLINLVWQGGTLFGVNICYVSNV